MHPACKKVSETSEVSAAALSAGRCALAVAEEILATLPARGAPAAPVRRAWRKTQQFDTSLSKSATFSKSAAKSTTSVANVQSVSCCEIRQRHAEFCKFGSKAKV
jgi:hypothetical protein